ncbi:Voltage-dependent P/Q-type calcium channel subunit alpha-1A [Exaiptasia diaphana]|nr:Voltage-dependent P/Q-type calcium channel subunit alpha-1A [Exaiptasia diaphana]
MDSYGYSSLIGFIWDSVESLKNNDLTQQKDTLKVLRAARVLRPLKIVSGIPSLQVVMKTIWRAMVPLLQILVLILFVIVIYAIVGLELLKGRFHYTCYNDLNQEAIDKTYSPPKICGGDLSTSGRPCPSNYTCKRNDIVWPGPNKGITNFDNIFLSMLTVFQCITMEGWTDIMYHSYDARDYNNRLLTSTIYISLIMIGSFFMLNLVLGVLSGEFAKERERVEHRRKFFKLRRQQQMQRMFDDYLEWINKAEDIMLREDREQHGVGEGGPRDPLKKRYSLSDSIMHLIEDHGEIIQHLKNKRKSQGTLSWSERYVIVRKFKKKERLLRGHIRSLVRSSVFYWGVLLCVFLNTVIMLTEHYDQPYWLDKTQGVRYNEKICMNMRTAWHYD